jgi:hypothetical protein
VIKGTYTHSDIGSTTSGRMMSQEVDQKKF